MGNSACFCFRHSFYYWGFKLGVFVMLIKVITTSVWAVCGLVTILFHMIGCDYQSDKIISDQSDELKKELDCRKEAKND